MPEPNDPTQDPTPPTPPAPPAIDLANLPPEVQSYIDQERTKASKTARANALKDAAQDPQIQAAVRAALEEEARMTADERVAQKERDLEQKQMEIDVKRNTLTVESVLIQSGIDKDNAVTIAGILATTDEKASSERANAFVETFNATVEAKVEAVKNELLANGGAPKKGGDAPTTEEQLRAAYKEATEQGKTAEAIAIQRRAMEQGITVQ